MSLYHFPEQPENRQGIANLIRQLFADLTELIQQHIELTKIEFRYEAKTLSKALIFGVIAFLFLQVALIFLGYIILILFLINRVNLIGASIATMSLFMVLTIVMLIFCLSQIRSAQTILKNPGQ